MKPVPLETELFVTSWDRQEASHSRYVGVERRIETGDLREARIPLSEFVNQFDLSRKMFRIIHAQSSQLFHDSRCHELRFTIPTAMHDSMSNCHERIL